MARPADPNARQALIAAARSEFVKHGMAKARIEDITGACKLSKGAFYLHFESKETLFGELVGQLDSQIQKLTLDRHAEYEECRSRFGLTAGKGRRAVKPEVLQALSDVDARYDRASLEVLWQYRDVVDVLMRGCRGTVFDGFIWQYLDTEVKRIADEVQRMSDYGLCRPDVPAEVAGSMLVGTFIMLARRMADAEAKPDIEFWVTALRVLMGEGLIPRSAVTASIAPSNQSAVTSPRSRSHPRRKSR